MSDTRRLRFLLIAVLVASTALLLATRWAGRLATSDVRSRREGPPAGGLAQADAAAGAPDLTFYKTLGGAATSGRRAPSPPAEPKLQPAPGDAVPPGGAFVVQALATRSQDQAQRVRDRLSSRGMPATIVEDSSTVPTIYRVRVGRWRERSTAEAWAAKIRDLGGLDPWVLQETGP